MQDGIGLGFLLIVCLVLIIMFVVMFSYIALYYVESVWIYFFKAPLYVHLYGLKKDIDAGHEQMLYNEFAFYRRLPEKHKRYFRHRVNMFLNRYHFHGRHGVDVTDVMRVKIAATWVMLTFGMRNYLPRVFEHIIIFPDIYESETGYMHKGEFNHPAGAVVFSWKHFEEGLRYGTDNINLGLHEFAHVLHVHATATEDAGASGKLYAAMFDRVLEYISYGDNLKNLARLGYLRDYAFTNRHEFMAVTLECFFETPDEFREKLPELYGMASRMINYSER